MMRILIINGLRDRPQSVSTVKEETEVWKNLTAIDQKLGWGEKGLVKVDVSLMQINSRKIYVKTLKKQAKSYSNSVNHKPYYPNCFFL